MLLMNGLLAGAKCGRLAAALCCSPRSLEVGGAMLKSEEEEEGRVVAVHSEATGGWGVNFSSRAASLLFFPFFFLSGCQQAAE